MPTTESLYQIIGVVAEKLSKYESQFLEVGLFIQLCEELKKFFKTNHQEYFHLIKTNTETENIMLEANFMQCVINEILLSEEYTIEGIACYTQTPEEVIYDIVAGKNVTPSLSLSRKIIEIHRFIRPDLYRGLMKKIITPDLVQQ